MPLVVAVAAARFGTIRFQELDQTVQGIHQEGDGSSFERDIRRWGDNNACAGLLRGAHGRGQIGDGKANVVGAATIANMLGDGRRGTRKGREEFQRWPAIDAHESLTHTAVDVFQGAPDRKSTRLNSSHLGISYA